METMEIKLKTLTPIWTGGVTPGQMDRLQETGIIGSLRWWYEAIVRGLGGDVCDPTSDNPDHRCQFDTKAYEKTQNIENGLAGVCPVCRLFGCTGWKRRFELQVSSTQLEPFWLATKDKPNKFNHWWLSEVYETGQSHVALGELTMCFRWMRDCKSQHKVMKGTLSLLSQLGAIGSKPQYGFGIVLDRDALSVNESLAIIKENLRKPEPQKGLQGGYPSLQDYWLMQCTIPQQDVRNQFANVNIVGNSQTFQTHKSHLLPVSFDIRYKLPGSSNNGLRQTYRLKHGKMPTRHVFGTLEGSEEDKRASSVFVSHLYKENESQSDYQLRVWGFINSGMVDEIETSLKSIFPNLKVDEKTTGTNLMAKSEMSA